MKCAIYKVFWVSTVRQIRFFVFMYLSTSILGSQKSCLTFTARIFSSKRKKTKSYLARGALSAHAKFEVAYKIYDGYLVRSAKHNLQFLNRTLVLALGNIAEGAMGFSAFFQQKKNSTNNSNKKSKMTPRCEQTIPMFPNFWNCVIQLLPGCQLSRSYQNHFCHHRLQH